MNKPILISGIQPTGKLHLGNYLGVLKNFVELQNSDKYQCYFFIADYHSLTEDFNTKEKSKQILDLIADYLAAGIDPKKSVIFIQSAVPAHVELAVILNNFTPFGELRRMTQFKEKSQENPFNINAGLFDYPVLMAADILLYDAQFVPVGEDQLQHLELTRTLARKFNSKFGKTFIEPKPLLTKAPRLMSLDDPMKKMSKSQAAGCLFIDDKPLMIKEKIKKAVTDSGKEIRYDPQIKPALSNLILIFSALSNYSIKAVERRFKNKGYAEFKKELAEIIIKTLVPFQKKKKKLKKQTSFIKKIISQGNKKANGVSSKKLLQIKEKIGLKI
ncbi:tryptophan--tRNA ligase [Candidatus Jorgensenbacteria bacterium CG_4_10_14_0_8_um_filter_39_13]|uniref:Tryptophan--tRNA ligase n=1 Tax=Candidatus Jorgensenbacteria bacterium CG_4_10_14_0_8_um_filter_39_13 TaxID=1974589 RepID=A0A2M7RGV5_9BACT|nr:MAG: tryptophan--tRNA ligase [Candidatus Jorgensenbacteria bacterium CG_4_10_14_0_8_um_filter_39_13]